MMPAISYFFPKRTKKSHCERAMFPPTGAQSTPLHNQTMATQCAQLVVMEDGVNFFPADDVSKHEPTCPETMEEYDTFKLDEQDVVLAQEAGRQRFNKNEVRPNMYSFDWSDAHGALWDRVKQKIVSETEPACI